MMTTTIKLKKNWAIISADSNHKYIQSFTFPVDEANIFTIGDSNDDHMQISNETNISCAKIEISPGENGKMHIKITAMKGTHCIKMNDKDLAPDSTEDLKDPSIICIGSLSLTYKLIPTPDATAYKEIMSSLTCSICLRLLIDPVTTCCSHTFCRSCMRNVISTPAVQGNNFHAEHIQCPLCRQNCCSNFGVDLKHVGYDRLPYKVSKVVCDFVESRPLCADCGNSRWLVPASEYYDCRTCVKNRNDAKDFIVCILCVIDGHKNHDLLSCKEKSINASRRFIDKVAPRLENYAKLRGEETELIEMVSSISNRLNSCKTHISESLNCMEESAGDFETSLSHINDSFVKFCLPNDPNVLRERQSMVNNLSEKFQKLKRSIEPQSNLFKDASRSLSNILAKVEENLTSSAFLNTSGKPSSDAAAPSLSL